MTNIATAQTRKHNSIASYIGSFSGDVPEAG